MIKLACSLHRNNTAPAISSGVPQRFNGVRFMIGSLYSGISIMKLVMRDSGHHGMVTFDQCMFRMYKEGKISYDDALRHADSANAVRMMITLADGGAAASLAQGLEGVEGLGDEY